MLQKQKNKIGELLRNLICLAARDPNSLYAVRIKHSAEKYATVPLYSRVKVLSVIPHRCDPSSKWNPSWDRSVNKLTAPYGFVLPKYAYLHNLQSLGCDPIAFGSLAGKMQTETVRSLNLNFGDFSDQALSVLLTCVNLRRMSLKGIRFKLTSAFDNERLNPFQHLSSLVVDDSRFTGDNNFLYFVEWLLSNNRSKKDLTIDYTHSHGNFVCLFDRKSIIGQMALRNLSSLTIKAKVGLNGMEQFLENVAVSKHLNSFNIELTKESSRNTWPCWRDNCVVSSRLIESIQNVLPICKSSSFILNFNDYQDYKEMKHSDFLNLFESKSVEWISKLRCLDKLIINFTKSLSNYLMDTAIIPNYNAWVTTASSIIHSLEENNGMQLKVNLFLKFLSGSGRATSKEMLARRLSYIDKGLKQMKLLDSAEIVGSEVIASFSSTWPECPKTLK